MSKFITFYINNNTVETKIKNYSGLLDAWESYSELDKQKLLVGDFIYLVNIKKFSLNVISALRIGEILTYEDFSQKYGEDLADGWEHGKWFYVASEATTMTIDQEVEYEDAKKLRFEDGKDQLVFNPPGSKFLDSQTLRRPRLLTQSSAQILNTYLDKFVKVLPAHINQWRTALKGKF